MVTSGWENMADWWNEKLGDEGDLWHRTLIDPPLIRLVGEVKGLHVLDLACGNGYLSRRFASQGAFVTGVDASMPVIEHARTREKQKPLGITYHIVDAAHLEMFANDTFDLVFCNMALMDIEYVAEAIREVARVLRAQGRFIASIAHPCFDKMDHSSWNIEYAYPNTTIWRKMSHYRELESANVPWKNDQGQTIYTRTYHRPLSWYFRTLRASGLLVAALEEPEPTQEFLTHSQQGPWIAEIPLHCVIEAWKVG